MCRFLFLFLPLHPNIPFSFFASVPPLISCFLFLCFRSTSNVPFSLVLSPTSRFLFLHFSSSSNVPFSFSVLSYYLQCPVFSFCTSLLPPVSRFLFTSVIPLMLRFLCASLPPQISHFLFLSFRSTSCPVF